MAGSDKFTLLTCKRTVIHNKIHCDCRLGYFLERDGELHLSVLIENMRREGYEFAVSKAEVLYRTDEDGKKTEPMERAFVDVPEEFSGTVISVLDIALVWVVTLKGGI